MIGARRLAGRYRLLNPLAEGDSGTVWLAADDVLGRDVAVKEVRLLPGLDESRRRELCETAVREAHAAARLKHPSIVTVHDVLIDEDRPWLVMELLNGTTLADMVRERGPLPPHQVARVGVHLLAALSVAHAAGVIHRGIRPDHVVLTRTGRAVLTDFGASSIAGEATMDHTAHLVGEPAYIPPERLRGEPDGPAGDLWSLGATLYFGVEGIPPHHADNPVTVLSKVLVEPPRPPERAGPLGPVLLDLLASEPGDRPALPDAARRLWPIAVKQRPAEPDTAPTPAPASASTPAPAPLTAPTVPVVPSANRRRRTLLTAAAMVGTLVATMAISATITNLTVGDPVAAQPAATPSRLSEKPGRFGIPVDFCGLLTADQVRQLLPEAKETKGEPDNLGGCNWTAEGMALSAAPIPVLTTSEKKGVTDQWGGSPRRAHERFVNQRNSTIPSGEVAWSWQSIGAKELRSARTTGPEPITGIGDEAFTYQTYDNRSHLKLERSHIVFRLDNLVTEVSYTVIDGRRDEKTIRAGARTLAGWVAAALRRMG